MTVLITGAAGGLGRAFANACAERGYDLFLTDLSGDGLALIAQGIQSRYPVRVLTHQCDLTRAGDVEALFRAAEAEGAKPDMLLNVAGIDFEGGFYERQAEELLQIVRLNVEATLGVTRRALDSRAPAKPFYIVFVSSLAAFYPMPLKATYAASKTFLRDFATALGQELRPYGVRVLTLCPGGLMTTDAALSGIAAQGFWGGVTTNALEKITRRTLTRVLKGDSLYIPGPVNTFFRFVGALVPRSLIAKLLYARWQSAQKKWLSV
ncbi:SDR family NAD(P)-dependent oxidoreductase [Oscillospiraceae bacterium CM]|nr:SDR family NAD(P)-dependent oxidoreductase [Oscillospiraceae bacterium CM]